MQTLATQLHTATRRLEAVTETPRLDAELLFAHALQVTRSKLLTKLHDTLDIPEIEPLIQRRLNHEPIAYITGTWEFFSLEFTMRPPMLVPRPETEHLVETALEFLAQRKIEFPRILDLCTGTGCVAIAIAKNLKQQAAILATDINPDAIALVRENAACHQVLLDTCTGDLFEALPTDTTPFDLITSNPPYVCAGEWDELPRTITRHEDPRALISGVDGLDIIRRMIAEAPHWLNPGGMLTMEMDPNQDESVKSLYKKAGFVKLRTINDLSGRPRIVAGELPD